MLSKAKVTIEKERENHLRVDTKLNICLLNSSILMEVISYMKKLGYVLTGVFLASLLVALPLLSQQAPRGQRRFQPGAGLQQFQADLEKVLDNLKLSSSQKELAMRVVRERADAFTKFMAAQANLARLARSIRDGQQVSDSEVKRVLSEYYDEQKKYFDTIAKTEKQIRSLPPKAQVVILAPGFMGGRRAGGQFPMGKGPAGPPSSAR